MDSESKFSLDRTCTALLMEQPSRENILVQNLVSLSSTAKDVTHDDRRQKRVCENNQQLDSEGFVKLQRDFFRTSSLHEQELDLAQKKATESQQREADLRQTLKSVRKEYEKELTVVRQRADSEKSDLIRKVCADNTEAKKPSLHLGTCALPLLLAVNFHSFAGQRTFKCA